jgi:glycerophosphoryl diester phosphodiesterase
MNPPARSPLVFGHRGTRRGAPENTLLAFGRALEQGADGIELDVRLCASGEVIVLHDRDLLRVAGVAIEAERATLPELRAHDLGAGERVPTLEQAFECVLERGAQLNVELKHDVPDAQALVDAVSARVRALSADAAARLLFSSFGRGVCEALRGALPDARVAFLFEAPGETPPRGMAALHPRYTLADHAAIERWHAQGFAVNVWTVNDAVAARRLADDGVDAIITDDVPLVRAALRS